MRAILIEEFGGPEVLQVVDLPTPAPGEGEVLIRVARAGMNFADTHQRQDQYVAKATPPFVPGSEVVGVREDTGERVIAYCALGGYAEYAVAPEDRTWPVPDGVDDDTAVALLVQGLTAWHLHRTSAQLRAGDAVVVHGAAG
ncbi:MAG: Alcohol dehydrogenase zinc-binding domain protein, partial [Solirubrobacteraceae bacterium]|nr:Alcohol dehydrogenase zinc-binding domain protein [Solirubrobacteraceae bacterium]